MNRDVFLSILSMDSYNRNYDRNIFVSGDNEGGPENEKLIGDAEITTDSSQELGAGTVADGFYAIAYDWNGETIISYRGTNFPSFPETISSVQGVIETAGER